MNTHRQIIRHSIVLVVLLTACSPSPIVQQPTVAPTTLAPLPPATVAPTTLAPTTTPLPTATPLPTIAPTSTVVPSPTPTFAPIEPTPTLAPLAVNERQQVFEQFWTLVNTRYVYTDYRGLDWQAIRTAYVPKIEAAATAEDFYQLLAALIEQLGDDHSVYLSPQEVAVENAQFTGTNRFGGIGVSINNVAEGVLITGIAQGSPAAEAGIQLREIITQIDGVSLVAERAAGRNGLLRARGEPGTTVRVTVRGADGSERDVVVTRRVISSDAFPSVESQRLPGTNAGLLRIHTFNTDNVDELIRNDLEQLASSGLDALIIDVRNNGGGRVDYLLNTCSLFLDGGTIGSDSGREINETLDVPAGQTLPQLANVPIAILVDGQSASAAEIFAAGMQARGRAIVVGEPSSGNTEVVVLHPLGDGSQLRLAERLYRRPDGSTIEGSGVQPDRLIAADWQRFASADDPQIQAALAALRQRAGG